jgi:hypothetical protein
MQALFACSNMEPAARTYFCPVHAVPGSSSCTNLLSSRPALGANNRTPMRGRGQATCCLTGRVAWIASSEWRQGTFGRGVRPASAWCTAARTLASGPRARWVAEKGAPASPSGGTSTEVRRQCRQREGGRARRPAPARGAQVSGQAGRHRRRRRRGEGWAHRAGGTAGRQRQGGVVNLWQTPLARCLPAGRGRAGRPAGVWGCPARRKIQGVWSSSVR